MGDNDPQVRHRGNAANSGSQVAVSGEASDQGNAVEGQEGLEQQQQQPQRNSFWGILRGLIFRMMIIYFISSWFRKPSTPPVGPKGAGPPGSPFGPSSNLFSAGTIFDLYAYVSENNNGPDFEMDEPIWVQKGLIYGDWTAGPNGDSSYSHYTELKASPSVQNNGSIWLHVYVLKEGYTPYPSDSHSSVYLIHKKYQLNRYRKRKYRATQNLLTGETKASKEEQEKLAKDIKSEVISHWHPNVTINIVDDHTPWTRGHVPPPLDQFIDFEPTTGKYYPVVYVNDYWNLKREYYPINDTVTTLPLRMTFYPLTMFKWQMYTAQLIKNQWMGMLSEAEEDDDDQDAIKEAFLETSPVLLGLTVVVSILHTVFEFMAFKNDIQFWKNRQNLEGLSVRSVFFNVFQSVIVLLYVLDNDTNTMVRISVFIGLLIECWKIFKVVDVSISRNEKMFYGIIPFRIALKDKGSYVESSTKEYDILAFRYLSWLLFPLVIGYAVYSVIYYEHKGWYSFVLNMIYGFLLTFGFIMMTPQLFINYKLKSVAHLPWRMLTYKFLNTFIDDIFAFVIKMPLMYRLGCFRDDIIFLIYVYQRWIYRVDPKRVNEFGISGEELDGRPSTPSSQDTPALTANGSNSPSISPKPDKASQKKRQ